MVRQDSWNLKKIDTFFRNNICFNNLKVMETLLTTLENNNYCPFYDYLMFQ